MPRRPGDTEPDPPGGRAAERLREFIDQRFPGRSPSREGNEAGDRRDEEGKEHDDTDREERPNE
jgi:hypothetical protein